VNAPSLYEVGKRLADDDPPQWLVQSLEFFARLIGQPKNDAELETIERKLFASAKYLQDWHQLYTGLERYGFEIPVCVDETTQNVEELLQFVAKQLAHSTVVTLVASSAPLYASKAIAFSTTTILNPIAKTYAKPVKTSGKPVATQRPRLLRAQQKDRMFATTGDAA